MAFFSIRNSLKIGIEISEKLNFWSEKSHKVFMQQNFPDNDGRKRVFPVPFVEYKIIQFEDISI